MQAKGGESFVEWLFFLCGLLRGYVMQCIVDKFLSRHFESEPSLYHLRIHGPSSRVREAQWDVVSSTIFLHGVKFP